MVIWDDPMTRPTKRKGWRKWCGRRQEESWPMLFPQMVKIVRDHHMRRCVATCAQHGRDPARSQSEPRRLAHETRVWTLMPMLHGSSWTPLWVRPHPGDSTAWKTYVVSGKGPLQPISTRMTCCVVPTKKDGKPVPRRTRSPFSYCADAIPTRDGPCWTSM